MSKKQTKKQATPELFFIQYKKQIIGVVILLLSIFAIFRAGIFGAFLYEIMRYGFGNFAYFFLITLIIVMGFVIANKEMLYFKTKYGIAYNLFFLATFFYMSNVFYSNKVMQYSLQNMINDIRLEAFSDGTGVFGWLISFSLIKLIGSIGLNVIIIGLVLVWLYLVIDIKKIQEFFAFEEDEEKSKEQKTKVAKAKKVDKEQPKDEVIKEEEPEVAPQTPLVTPKKNSFLDFQIRKKTKKPEPDPLFGVNRFDVKVDEVTAFTPNIDDDPIINGYKNEEFKPKTTNKPITDEIFGKNKDGFTITEIDDKKPEVEEAQKAEPIKDIKPSVEPKVQEDTTEVTTPSGDIDVPIYMQEGEDVREDIQDLKVAMAQKNYQIPSIELLNGYGDNSKQLAKLRDVAKQKAQILKNTLDSFGLRVEILNIHIGPNVTKYELQPEMGVKVSKFNSLSNDIAMALAASGVRIEAPIPGKAAVGIEIANDQTMMVSLKEVLLSNNNEYDKKLQIGLGKDISGSAIFSDITKTPHLLVAGSTGSGKSVCINSIIVSILTKASPDEVKLLMVDPKKVELTPYNGIPHLLAPVVTEPKKAVSNLKQMVVEMEWRYELFAETNTRNIDGYNRKVANDDSSYSKLPYIVIIIDELADLMMVASNEVETSIARLAQMARAAGIHLIIATQRPSTDVITGLIKANIPSRIAFAVSSSIDSRTILDQSGAEKLLGRGDMLLAEQGSNNLHRIQGAFLSDEEVELIVDAVASQFTEEELESLQNKALSEAEYVNQINNEELDELYDEVRADVISSQKASTSQIQRRFKVGYNRAANIMDQLESNGIISPNEGTKPRRVLIEDDDDSQEE